MNIPARPYLFNRSMNPDRIKFPDGPIEPTRGIKRKYMLKLLRRPAGCRPESLRRADWKTPAGVPWTMHHIEL